MLSQVYYCMTWLCNAFCPNKLKYIVLCNAYFVILVCNELKQMFVNYHKPVV